MPLKIKFIKDDDEGILPYCEEEKEYYRIVRRKTQRNFIFSKY